MGGDYMMPYGPYPYNMNMQYPMYTRPSLLQNVKYSINQLNLSSTLQTTQKTIYTINQIIPIINQLRPIINNASTAFRVAKTMKNFNFDDIDKEIIINEK